MKHSLPAIQIDDLTVAYDYKPALWDIDLTVPEGVLMAVVGPNGAGKSTMIKAVLGIVKPIAGSIRVFGEPYKSRWIKWRTYRKRAVWTGTFPPWPWMW